MRFVVYGAGAVGGVVGGRSVRARPRRHPHRAGRAPRGHPLRGGAAHRLTGRIGDRWTCPRWSARRGHSGGRRGGDARHEGPAHRAALRRASRRGASVRGGGVPAERRRQRARGLAVLRAGVRGDRHGSHRSPRTWRGAGVGRSGRRPSSTSAATRPASTTLRWAVAEAISSSAMVSEARADIMAWKHRKLIMNLGNSVQALVRAHDASRADRIGCADRRPASVRRRASIASLVSRTASVGATSSRSVRSANRTRDPAARPGRAWPEARGVSRPTILNGEIVLLGRLHGVPTPCNALLQAWIARAVATGRRSAQPTRWPSSPSSTPRTRSPWCAPMGAIVVPSPSSCAISTSRSPADEGFGAEQRRCDGQDVAAVGPGSPWGRRTPSRGHGATTRRARRRTAPPQRPAPRPPRPDAPDLFTGRMVRIVRGREDRRRGRFGVTLQRPLPGDSSRRSRATLIPHGGLATTRNGRRGNLRSVASACTTRTFGAESTSESAPKGGETAGMELDRR
jgi:2-dehydropantoate 2-reductase